LQSSSTLKTVFLSVWLALVAGIVVAIFNQDKFFAVELKPIASLDEKAGSVMARSEGLVRWREAVDHQDFYDGDRVATGAESRSTVRFDASRRLQLGEDTQVQITSIQQADGALAFMITLFRGSMAAETDGACANCPPLILRDAGGDTYNVMSGKKIALQKTVGKKAATFDAKAAWPLAGKAVGPKPLLKANFVKIAKLDPAEQAAEEARLKKEQEEREEQEKKDKEARDKALKDKESKDKDAKDKKDKEEKDKKDKEEKEKREREEKEKKDKENAVKGSEALLAATVNGTTLWTMEPLSGLSGATVEVPFSAPAQHPEGWKPALELGGGGKPVVLEGDPASQSFRFGADLARKAGSTSRNNGIAELVFTVRGGAVVSKDKDKSQSFSAQRAEMRIKSLGEVGGGPVTVALDGLKAAAGKGPWLDPKSALTTADAPVAVSLASGGDYAKLVPFVRGAGGVGFGHDGIGNDGVFVVRQQAVVAQVRGSKAADKATAGGVMRALGGEFVFKGSKAALYDMRGQTQTALVDWVGALLDKGKVLYILKKNKLYPVSRDFIKTNNEVAKFIDTQARAIFLERVDILDYR
jgi:hypothetical protein